MQPQHAVAHLLKVAQALACDRVSTLLALFWSSRPEPHFFAAEPRDQREAICLQAHARLLSAYHSKPAETQAKACATYSRLRPPLKRLVSDSWRGELVQQRLRVLQVGGFEAFGEPVVDHSEHRARLLAAALFRE